MPENRPLFDDLGPEFAVPAGHCPLCTKELEEDGSCFECLECRDLRYAWECAENMRDWALRAEEQTKHYRDVLTKILMECSHRELIPEPCPVCLAEIALEMKE